MDSTGYSRSVFELRSLYSLLRLAFSNSRMNTAIGNRSARIRRVSRSPIYSNWRRCAAGSKSGEDCLHLTG